MKQKLRIGMLHATLPSVTRVKEGGVTYLVHRLANKLVERGHEVTVYSLDQRPNNALYQVKQFDALSRLRRGPATRYLYVSCVFAKHRKELESCDIVHAHGDDWLLWGLKTPLVRTFHGSSLGEAMSSSSLKQKILMVGIWTTELISSVKANLAVGVSVSTRRHIPFVRQIVPPGINLERYHPLRPKSVNPSILFVGTIEGRKRGRLLVETFADYVQQKIPKAELWLVTEKKVTGRRIICYGKVDEERLVELYQKAWLFCMPSSYEGFGVPFTEAMACGTPVVTTPNPGAKEVLQEGEYGIIVDAKNLGIALCDLIKDTARRRELTKRSRDYVQRFSLDRVVKEYEAIYYSLLGK